MPVITLKKVLRAKKALNEYNNALNALNSAERKVLSKMLENSVKSEKTVKQ